MNGVIEVFVFSFHHPGEDIAASGAAEAVEQVSSRMDEQRRVVVVMPQATSHELTVLAGERDSIRFGQVFDFQFPFDSIQLTLSEFGHDGTFQGRNFDDFGIFSKIIFCRFIFFKSISRKGITGIS